jgi:competence protein ComEA
VGEVIAERILEYRRTKRFETPEELMEVKGIGPKKFERLRPYIRVR